MANGMIPGDFWSPYKMQILTINKSIKGYDKTAWMIFALKFVSIIKGQDMEMQEQMKTW